MFIAIITYKKPVEEVNRFLGPHCDFLSAYISIGNIIAAGPQNPASGGVILLKADSCEEVDDIISRDPWNVRGLVDYQIVEFIPTMIGDPRLVEVLS